MAPRKILIKQTGKRHAGAKTRTKFGHTSATVSAAASVARAPGVGSIRVDILCKEAKENEDWCVN